MHPGDGHQEDLDGKRTTLSQTIIEVPSNSDKIKTLVAGGVFVCLAACVCNTCIPMVRDCDCAGLSSCYRPANVTLCVLVRSLDSRGCLT